MVGATRDRMIRRSDRPDLRAVSHSNAGRPGRGADTNG